MMRKTLLPLLALAGFAASGALNSASAAPAAIAFPVASTQDAAVQTVQYYRDDWRAREWRRHERWEAWHRHEDRVRWYRWHRWHDYDRW